MAEVISTSRSSCVQCQSRLKSVNRNSEVFLYTDSGTKKVIHEEIRCTNCRVSHRYGYSVIDRLLSYESVGKHDYLLTSQNTGFEVQGVSKPSSIAEKIQWDISHSKPF